MSWTFEAPPGVPEAWSHTVTAGGDDSGPVFDHRRRSVVVAAQALGGKAGAYLD